MSAAIAESMPTISGGLEPGSRYSSRIRDVASFCRDGREGKKAVNVHPVALSSRDGAGSLHIPVDESGVEHDASASIENIAFAQARHQLVPLRSLDAYRFEGVALVKIDVEGHEYSVIEGAEKTIAASRPALLIEIEQRHIRRPIAEVFEKIEAFGYQGFFMGKRATPLDEFTMTRHQSMESFGGSRGTYINNFLFLHRDKVANGVYHAPMGRKFSK